MLLSKITIATGKFVSYSFYDFLLTTRCFISNWFMKASARQIKKLRSCSVLFNRSDGPVVERLSPNRLVVGSSPGRSIPKTLKMVLTAFMSGARHMRMEWES